MSFALFEISVKALITKNGKILTLTTDSGFIDFPGGRLDDSEYNRSFKSVLKREITEELGYEGDVVINDFIMFTKGMYKHNGTDHFVARIFYSVIINYKFPFLLSDEHVNIEWLSPAELLLRESNFISKDEFKQFKSFYQTHKP
jgi:8-oxo-dGTP pyrophosphatase MutT (NUDIX family)